MPADGRARLRVPAGIFRRFAWRSLCRNRSRTFVSIVGVALSCALVTAIFTSVATLYRGLLSAELIHDGSWQLALKSADEDAYERLLKDDRIEDSHATEVYGAALMPASYEGYWGRYLTLASWPDPVEVGSLLPAPVISEGRAPTAPGEVALELDMRGGTVATGQWLYSPLPSSGRDADVPRASWDGAIDIGSTLKVPLGTRMHLDDEGRAWPCPTDYSLYTESGEQGDRIVEWLAGVQSPMTLTVVGFYDGREPGSLPDAWVNDAGYLGFVAPGTLPVQARDVYASTNLGSRADFDALCAEYSADTPESPRQTPVYAHDSLLRYQGIVGDSSIWGTLYAIAGILSAVVVAASISLIYNAFAIAVAERTRQFGLLASLGASRRQLRRTVYVEALLIAAVGIPIGLAVGLLGTQAVFAVSREGIGLLIDEAAFASAEVPGVVVEPSILALSAALTLATVLASAYVPARRASRVSAVDAIKLSRDIRMEAPWLRRARPIRRRLDDLALALTGVPGFMARRNIARSSGKGRVAVASLAVSVALIIISGSISHYLGYLVTATEQHASDMDLYLARTLQGGETTSDGVTDLVDGYRELSATRGVHGRGLVVSVSAYGSLEAGMVDESRLAGDASDNYAAPEFSIGPDGTAYALLTLYFVDDSTWTQIVRDNHLDAERYADPNRPAAAAINGQQVPNGDGYRIHSLFKQGGDASVYTHIGPRGLDLLATIGTDSNGSPVAMYEPFDEDGDEKGPMIEVPLDEAVLDQEKLPVEDVITKVPASLASTTLAWPGVIMPLDMLPTLAAGSEDLVPDVYSGIITTPLAFHPQPGGYENALDAYMCFDADNPRAAETEMRTLLNSSFSSAGWYRTWLSNNAEDARTSQVMYETIQLFITCFIAITTAIAVANVFNTLSSSIILRKREFAMLKSIGMGEGAFWRMIALECLSYAWRGMVLGILIGALVTLLIFTAVGATFRGLAFTMPLPWVAAAIVLVAIVLAASTMYALRRAGTGSIVTTLREDSI